MTDSSDPPPLVGALVTAAKEGDLKTVEEALARDSGVVKHENTDDCYRTMCWYAAEAGHLDIIKRLYEVDKGVVAQSCTEGISPLQIAAQGMHAEVVKFLVSAAPELVRKTDEYGGHALSTAIFVKSPECVQLIFPHADLAMRADIEDKNMLHCAVEWSAGSDIIEFLAKNHPQYMVEQNEVGDTPLHAAVAEDQLEAVRIIARYSPKEAFRLTNAKGQTARDLAVPGSAIAQLVEEQAAP